MKSCTMCREEKPEEEFYKNKRTKDGLFPYCKICSLQHTGNYMRKRRIAVITAYGGKCTCCGESEYQFLAIDHVQRDGVADRKKRGGPTGMIGYLYRLVLNNELSGDYRLLCHNCNMAMSYYESCPHKKIT